MSEETLVVKPDWLNADFIEQALRKKKNDPNLKIVDCNIINPVSVGENYSSIINLATCKIQAGSDEYSKSFIVKTLPRGAAVAYVNNQNCFSKEIKMLDEVIPALQKILLKAGQDFNLAPEIYYAALTPHPVLVMEDMSKRKFEVGPRREGLNLEQCITILKKLACFHAASFIHLKENPDVAEYFSVGFWGGKNREFTEVLFVDGLEKIMKEIDSWSNVKWSEQLRNLSKRIPDIIYELFDRKDTSKPNVLNHGDIWTNNVMLRKKGCGLYDCCLIDLQLCSVRSPIFDLMYFIFTSPRNDIRITNLDTMLRSYYETWVQVMSSLGVDPVYTLESLQQEFKEKILFAFAISYGPFAIISAKKENAPDTSTKNKEMSQSLYDEDFQKAFLQNLEYFKSLGLFEKYS